jgi:putative addiction module component (TIGR02574 family)
VYISRWRAYVSVMNQRLKTIFADAQKLSSAEREELAELLLATIEPDETVAEIEKAWAEEAERRWEEHKQSGEVAIDAFAAIDDVRARLQKRGGK